MINNQAHQAVTFGEVLRAGQGKAAQQQPAAKYYYHIIIVIIKLSPLFDLRPHHMDRAGTVVHGKTPNSQSTGGPHRTTSDRPTKGTSCPLVVISSSGKLFAQPTTERATM
uniref:Uncharacterized protein n=1 Tax=Anopheles coluzzii TaxID=1518534 RepID=A0A8W7P935_ANOCL